MNHEKIPEGATQLSMEYTLWYTIPIVEDIKREDIKQWWVKYGYLMIEMNDGTIHEMDADAEWDHIDWKRGQRNLRWVDDDYQEVEEE